MKTKTVRTPAIINIAFFALLILPILVFLSIKQVSASTDCRTEWENWFFQQVTPELQKQCGKKFEYYTRIEIKRMNNWAVLSTNK